MKNEHEDDSSRSARNLGCLRQLFRLRELPTLPEPPDRTTEERERERRADRERHSKMLKRFGWTDADYETAKRYGFPASLGRVSTGAWTSEAIFSRRAVAEWCANIKAFAANLPK